MVSSSASPSSSAVGAGRAVAPPCSTKLIVSAKMGTFCIILAGYMRFHSGQVIVHFDLSLT